MTTSKASAIRSLCPKAEFSITGGVVKFDALNGETEPTDSQISAEQTRLDDVHTSKKYQRDRATSYPSIQDQLDMQYWDKVNGTTKWKEAVAKVKSDNPKP